MKNELAALGENIRTLRRHLGISQEELADRANLHRTYISDVERGQRNLSFSCLSAIARGLGVTVSDLTQNTSLPGNPPGHAAGGPNILLSPGPIECKQTDVVMPECR